MADDNGNVLTDIAPGSIRRIHLVGVAGTGMGSFAGMLKAAGYEVTGSDENVYPPMSDMLAAWGIAGDDAVLAREPRRGEARPRDHRQRHPPREPRGDRGARARHPADELPRGARLARPRGASTASSSPARTARRRRRRSWRTCSCDAGTDPSFLVGGVTLNYDAQLPDRRRAVRRGRRRRVRHRLLRQGPEVPALPRADGDPHQRRVRPRRHLPRHGALRVGVREVRRDASRGRLPRRRARRTRTPCAIAQTASRAYVATYAAQRRRGLRRPSSSRFGPEGARFVVREPRGRTGEFLLPMSGHHNVENALGVYAAARALGLTADDDPRRLRVVRRREAPAGDPRRGRRRPRDRRLRAPPHGGARDDRRDPPALPRPAAVGGVRAALQHQPPQHPPGASTRPRSTARRSRRSACPSRTTRCRSTSSSTSARSWTRCARRASTPTRRPTWTCIVRQVVVDGARPGDVVLVMSNGAFGGFIPAVLEGLRARHAA